MWWSDIAKRERAQGNLTNQLLQLLELTARLSLGKEQRPDWGIDILPT